MEGWQWGDSHCWKSLGVAPGSLPLSHASQCLGDCPLFRWEAKSGVGLGIGQKHIKNAKALLKEQLTHTSSISIFHINMLPTWNPWELLRSISAPENISLPILIYFSYALPPHYPTIVTELSIFISISTMTLLDFLQEESCKLS